MGNGNDTMATAYGLHGKGGPGGPGAPKSSALGGTVVCQAYISYLRVINPIYHYVLFSPFLRVYVDEYTLGSFVCVCFTACLNLFLSCSLVHISLLDS